jgi:hypothetical protein
MKKIILINKILDISMVVIINEFLIQLKHLNEKLSIGYTYKNKFHIFSAKSYDYKIFLIFCTE